MNDDKDSIISSSEFSSLCMSFSTCKKISDSPLILSDEFPTWAAEGAFTLLLIHLNDILQFLGQKNRRVNFKDDLPEDVDVTEQVRQLRNAVCHVKSGDRYIGTERAYNSFSLCYGQATFLKFNEAEISCPYSDEVTLAYGNIAIFHKRHILRALKEVDALGKEYAEALGKKDAEEKGKEYIEANRPYRW